MPQSSSPSRRRWPLVSALAAGGLLAAYLGVTSAPFLRSVLLPRVGAALNCDLTAGGISLSPFSSLTLRDVRLTPRGGETLFTAGELRVRYRLTDLIRGRISVSEAILDNPVVTLVTAADGTSNLPRISSGPVPQKAATRDGTADVPALEVRNVALRNGVFRWTQMAGPAARTVEMTGINLTLDTLVPGTPGLLKLGASYRVVAEATNVLAGLGSGEFQFRLNEKLQLRELNGTFDLNAAQSGGQWSDFARVAFRLSADSTGSEIREIRLAVTDRGQPAGEVRMSGPMDLDKQEARIAYEVKGLGRSALGLAGALAGVDFGATQIQADGRLNLERGGARISWEGRFAADPLSVTTASGTTPVLGVTAEVRASADLEQKSALLEKADLSVRQAGSPVIQGSLDLPMRFAWGTGATGTNGAAYVLAIRALDLAPWRSFAGAQLPAGRADLEFRITSERDGHLLRGGVTGGLSELSFPGAPGTAAGLRLDLKGAGKLDDFQEATVEQFVVQLQQGAQRLAQASALAQVNLPRQEFSGQVTGDASLVASLKAFPVEGADLTGGAATLSAQVSGKSGQTNASLVVALGGLSGVLQGVALKDYEARLDLAGSANAARVLLQRGLVSLRAGSGVAGGVDVTGEFEPTAKRGAFRFQGTNLNESTLGPLLVSALKPQRLETITVELSGSGSVDLAAKSTLASSIQVSRFLVRDPAASTTGAPLALGLSLQGSGQGRSFDLTQFLMQLPVTPRARNELRATGHLELDTNNAASGTLSLSSAALDLTPFADLTSGAPPSPSVPSSVDPKPAGRPGEPIHLPIGHFVADAKLDAVFFREVAVSNWVARLDIQRDRMVVSPFSLTLNGAPVSASLDLNLGVEGYEYAVKGDLAAVPVAPLAKSFLSGDRVDLSGTADASLDLKGAGVDGSALRKHLAGTAGFSATNLNYRITALKSPLMKTLVRTLSTSLQIPGIEESPIRTLEARIRAGQGVVNLSSARVASDAFQAAVRGEVRIADILTNSAITLPVTVSLPRNGVFEELPTFLTFKGTVGAPRPDVDALALARTLTRLPGAAGALSVQGAEKLGSALDRALGGKSGTNAGAGTSLIQGLLGGRPAATNAAGATNAAKATNTTAAPFNPLDLFKKKPAQP
jgi:AsmA-like C-terminal region